jgi:transcriptional regulator with XRE-family HTH domain
MIDPFEGRRAYILCKRRRKQLKMGQPELSIASGISQASISKFESGDSGLSFDKYFSLLRALGITVSFKREKIEKK